MSEKKPSLKERATKILTDIHEETLSRSRKLRKNGQRCCANQLLHMAKYIESKVNEL